MSKRQFIDVYKETWRLKWTCDGDQYVADGDFREFRITPVFMVRSGVTEWIVQANGVNVGEGATLDEAKAIAECENQQDN